MADALEELEKQVKRRNFDSPPLHLWHPALSGDIPIRIAADGRWYHDGTVIRRESLVRLFASILRREEDGHYYLVTPAEKWRISVELHPLTGRTHVYDYAYEPEHMLDDGEGHSRSEVEDR